MKTGKRSVNAWYLGRAAGVALLVAGIFAGCNSGARRSDDTSMDSARSLNRARFPDAPAQQQHAQYLMTAYAGGLYEIRSSEEAVKRSGDPRVKQLAAFLIKAHQEMNGTIDSLAAGKQMSLPGGLSGKQQGRLNTLLNEKGPAFDDDYLRQMAAGHKDMISLLHQVQTSDDPAMINWANAALPKIIKHLDRITSCRKAVDSLQKQ